MHEPVTAITNLILAGAAAYFAWSMWRAGRKAWSLAFLFTALANLLAGAHHGFAIEPLWKPTVYSVGLASMFLMIGVKPSWTVIAVLKFMAYASWMIKHDDFKYVIIDYGLTLIVVAILQSVEWFRSGARSAPWIVGSICVSVFGALVQQMGVGIHRHFNHNDLYHVIQLVGLWMLYRGGLLVNRPTPTDRPTTQPT